MEPVAESGTDHALYRLGAELVVRLPIIDRAVEQTGSDERWLPALAPHLTLPVPVPVAVGQPGEGYPWPWSVVPWIPGETPMGDNLDLTAAAADLARSFMPSTPSPPTEVRSSPGPRAAYRWHAWTRGYGRSSRTWMTTFDRAAVTRAWNQAVSAPRWDAPLVWIHGDPQPGNLIVRGRRLAAVIDLQRPRTRRPRARPGTSLEPLRSGHADPLP
ncbi:MAG: phosphotransferase [Nocardioidaceae bacterium]